MRGMGSAYFPQVCTPHCGVVPVPMTPCLRGPCSRVRTILDLPVQQGCPWYSLTSLPVPPLVWVRRSKSQCVLYCYDMPVRLFVAAPVASLYFYSSLTDNMARSRITLKLMRAADRAGLARLHDKGRSTMEDLSRPPASPMDRFTAIAIHNRTEVRCRDRREVDVSSNWVQVFSNVYDASERLEDKTLMKKLSPAALGVGDIVVVESVVVRTQHDDGWNLSFRTYAISRLLAAPRPTDGNDVDQFHDLPVPRFTHVL